MIVTFRPTINTGASTSACYMNFLRCVTAIATAPAGTTTLTVNPYTASNTIDSTKNCIVSIDANTEAGGWTTSASHNVPSSGNNTPQTWTEINSAAAFLYKADLYNNSGKSAFPYNKLCFHSYNDDAYYSGSSYSGAVNVGPTKSMSTGAASNMLITFGCSTTTDWTDTNFPPAGGSAGGYINAQSNSYTLNANNLGTYSSNIYNSGPGLVFNNSVIVYKMAVTQDYCIIWEGRTDDAYGTGYFVTETTGPGYSYWNSNRFGSMYYMGFRATQPWEDALPNNPPWVCWQTTITQYGNGGTGGNQGYPHDQVAAFMSTLNNNGIASSTPTRYVTTGSYNQPFFHAGRNSSQYSSVAAYYQNQIGNALDGPIFQTRGFGSGSDRQQFSSENGASQHMLYKPQYDPVTGTHVPGAYPIMISRSYTGAWNAGGECRGVYKSLSMPWTTMKLYYQAERQTFTINGETYLPVVIREDMWLVRMA